MEPPSKERWQHIEALLDVALEDAHQPHTRERSTDPDLQAEVERLLSFRERARHFLDTPAAEFAAALLEADAQSGAAQSEILPEHIGPYRILREAGRGGMATVYLAERADPQLHHRVAVKVLREGIISSSLVRRFLNERQILASLDHPGIARLLDGGLTDEGRPWFAMEYVDGVPITRYCAERRLNVEARLALFLDVCAAVQYAHGRLIVHRDLKPSNILVTEDAPGDAPGRVKLLDFGIARLLAPDPLLDTAVTRTGMMPLTPEYASPEQFRGEPVTTSSDVYQLGVLLYELLAGRRPHQLAGKPLHEVHRIVHEEIPPLPSSVVDADAPERLGRRLRGDLDNIVIMALRNAAQRRYASVERLADDVRRHLRGEPVSARADTLRYRAGKFIGRHRLSVTAAALVFLLLSGLAGALAVQASRIARERDRAEQATAFLVDMFGAFEPLEARGVTVTVPNILEYGLQRAHTELADQPLLQATVLDVIANVYELQGLHAQAEPLLEEALNIRFAALGPAHIEVAHSRRRLADLRYERGSYGTESLYRAALQTYDTRLRNNHPDVIRTRISLGMLLRARGNYAAADSLLRRSLPQARALAELQLDVPIVLSFLGKLRTRAGDYVEAERLIRESLALRESLLGREHPAVANSLDALGEVLLARGAADSAEILFRAALAIRQALYDEQHTDIASGRTYLARARADQGDLVGADSLLNQALPVFRRAFGDESPDVAEVLEYLGANRMARAELNAADTLFRNALAIWRGKQLEPTHDRTATLLVRLGALNLARGNLDVARTQLQEGLALREAALPPDHWQMAQVRSLLGSCLSTLGHFREAEPLLLEGYDRIRVVRGPNDVFAQRAAQRLVDHFLRSGQPERARPYRM